VITSLPGYFANSLTALFIEDHEPLWAFRIVRDWVLGSIYRSAQSTPAFPAMDRTSRLNLLLIGTDSW
jgi:hypothetical protein